MNKKFNDSTPNFFDMKNLEELSLNPFQKHSKNEKLNKNSNILKLRNLENYIIAYVNAMKDQILNHYSPEFDQDLKPNKVYINGELIYTTDNYMGESFYSYTYPSDGQYAIKMEWNSAISSTSNLFVDCSALVSLDLSNFDT